MLWLGHDFEGAGSGVPEENRKARVSATENIRFRDRNNIVIQYRCFFAASRTPTKSLWILITSLSAGSREKDEIRLGPAGYRCLRMGLALIALA